MPKASLVVTTIFDPIILEYYYENLKKHNHLEHIQVFLIPDVKTPPQAYMRCKDITRRGLKIICPTIDKQEEFLKRLGLPSNFIPYNSDNRRNIGYLMALESGSDFIISIDDDNYPRKDEDYFTEHSCVCSNNYSMKIINTDSGWFNICSMLEFDRQGTFYPRGFPYFARHKKNNYQITTTNVDIHMNAGLWLIDPDMDGISWLVSPTHAINFKGNSYILDKTAWSPVNTQNTSMRKDVIASYYFVKMNYPLYGMPIDRYGDIFSGYFAQACIHHMNGAIRVGSPVAEHKRNSHNYMKDASNEWACIQVLEDLLPWLIEVKLDGNSYNEVYTSLSYAMEDAVECFNGKIWSDATRGYFHQMAYCMRQWINACKIIS